MADYYDIAQSQDARAWAEQAAQAAYYNSMAAGNSAQQALAQAQFEWKKKLDEAGQTGMWNGQWNNPQEQWFTSQFGQWFGPGGAPQAGQQTLSAQEQAAQQAQAWSGMFGQYLAPGTAPAQGQQTQAAIQAGLQNAATVAGLTGMYNAPGATGPGTQTLAGQQQQFTQGLQTQQEARAAQQQQQAQAMQYLNLLSNLRGPADWAKYQQVLGSTPGGMRDLVAAAAGQYVPGGGATTGYQPQAVSLQSLMGDVSGNPYTGQGGGQLNMPNVYGGGQGMYQQQPQTMQWNQAQPANMMAGTNQYDWTQQQGQPGRIQNTGQETWGSGLNVGQQQATPQQQQQALGGGTNLPAPNQISAQSWKNMAPSQQQMMLGMYENQGWNKDDVTALMNQSLPKYGASQQTGSFKM